MSHPGQRTAVSESSEMELNDESDWLRWRIGIDGTVSARGREVGKTGPERVRGFRPLVAWKGVDRTTGGGDERDNNAGSCREPSMSESESTEVNGLRLRLRFA